MFPYTMKSGDWDVTVDIDEDDDVRKINAEAVNRVTGERKFVPHTPYEHMTQAALDFHVANGFKRLMVGSCSCNYRNEDIEKENAA